MPERRGCIVPFCPRWSRRFDDEWICADHWRLVPRAQKALRTALRRRWRARWAKLEAERDSHPEDSKARFLANRRLGALNKLWRHTEHRIWERMKKAAIERATGL